MHEGRGQRCETVGESGFAALLADLDHVDRAAPLDDGLRRMTASIATLRREFP